MSAAAAQTALNSTIKYLTAEVEIVMLVWARYFFHVLFVLLILLLIIL